MKPLLPAFLKRKAPHASESAQPSTAAQKVDLWFHATERSHISAFLQLRRSISTERPDLRCLMTSDGSLSRPEGLDPLIHWHNLSGDRSSEIASFFERFSPALCLWAGGRLMPALIAEADRRSVVLFLLDAVASAFQSSLWRGAGVFERRALRSYSVFLARDEEGAAALQRLGIAESDILVTGRLQQGVPSLPYNETDLADLTEAINNRPVWLAACLRAGEIETILEAHLKASRAAHRLLLLVVPDDEDEFQAFRKALKRRKTAFSVWPDLSGLADETSHVLLAEDPFEMGLWLRAAPLCFLGCSLISGHGGHNPYAAANLGSAILYGPNVRNHLESYTRFAQAGGARIVRDVETLAAAVSQLSAPDRAAQMAMAAWELATEGAEVTDRVTNLVHDALDHLETP